MGLIIISSILSRDLWVSLSKNLIESISVSNNSILIGLSYSIGQKSIIEPLIENSPFD